MNFLTDEKKLNAELEIRLKITEMDLVKLILDQRKSFKPQNLLLKIHSWIIKMTQSVFLESKLNLISAVLEYIVEWQLECSHHSRMGRAITYFVAETIEIIDTHSDCLDPNDIIDFALNLIIVYFQFPEVYYYDSVGIPENGKFPCETREKIRKLAHDAKTMCAERTALVHYDIASQGLEAARMGLSHVKNQNCRFDHLDICEYNQIEAIDKVLLDSLQFAETFVKQSDDYLTEVLETDPTSISGDRLKLLYERLSFSSKSARLQVELLLNQLGFLSNRLI